MKSLENINVESFSRGIIGPSINIAGTVKNGGIISVDTAPGCWGPMITPIFKGGHEVTKPVAVENAKIGDAIAIYINKIEVKSLATSSGVPALQSDRYKSDPYVDRYCPSCGTKNPITKIVGVGQEAVRCANCGAEISPFKFANGYTMVFDNDIGFGFTVNKNESRKLAKDARSVMALPQNSEQNPIVIMCPSDIVGTASKMRPFIGNIGTTPPINMPDSHNAGDFGQFLIGALHEYAITKEQLSLRTDSHMDINTVRAGAIIVCPVKVDGGGVFIGDVHAMQGDGEVAGHTTDVSARVEISVHVIKGLEIEGPLVFPMIEDLPFLAKPFSSKEKNAINRLAKKFHQIEYKVAPIQQVGSGLNINEAFDNSVERLSKLLNYSREKILNLTTITGGIEIGRLPGIVTTTIMVPVDKLKEIKLYDLAKEQHYL